MKKLTDAMTDVLPPEVLRAARALSVLKQWDTIVGSHLAAKSSPDRYERGVVWVSVQGSAWAQEMRMHRETILTQLNSMAEEPGLFVDIRFGVRAVKTPGSVEPAVEAVELEDLSGLTIREIAERRLAKLQAQDSSNGNSQG
jgi:hypothetical protein